VRNEVTILLAEDFVETIVIVSAYDSPGFRSAAETVGCLEYLKKPIDFDQLEIIIDRLLPGKQRSVARRA
jgi:DNA-binding NarL/FixJ family response regulator